MNTTEIIRDMVVDYSDSLGAATSVTELDQQLTTRTLMKTEAKELGG